MILLLAFLTRWKQRFSKETELAPCISQTTVSPGNSLIASSAMAWSLPEPSPELFTFNSPIGACRRCEGFGHVIGIDPSRIVPDPRLSIYEDAIACWRGERMSKWKDRLCLAARDNDIPIHSPWRELTSTQQEVVWDGGKGFKGLNAFFKYLEEKSYKIQFRVMLSRYRGRTTCPECAGTRLGKASHNVFIGGKDLTHVLRMPAKDALVILPIFVTHRNATEKSPNDSSKKSSRGSTTSAMWDSATSHWIDRAKR